MHGEMHLFHRNQSAQVKILISVLTFFVVSFLRMKLFVIKN